MDSPGLSYDWIEIGSCDFDTQGLNPFTPERGLLVEPLQQYLDRLPAGANIQKVNAAVCAEDGNALVYSVPPETIEKYNLPSWLRGCNRMFDPHPLARPTLLGAGLNPEEHIVSTAVETITWAALVRRARIGSVAYLKIDTEGGESEIIRQVLTLGQQRPDLYPGRIKFETNSNTPPADIEATVCLLGRHGYQIEETGEDTIVKYCGPRGPAQVLPKVALFTSAGSFGALGRISASVAAYPSDRYDLRAIFTIEALQAGGFCAVIAQTFAMMECVERNVPSLVGRVSAVCHGPIEMAPGWISDHGGGGRATSQMPIGGVSQELVGLIGDKYRGGVHTPRVMHTPCGIDLAMFSPSDADDPLRVLFPRSCNLNECHADTKRFVLAGRLIAHFKGHKDIEVACIESVVAYEQMPRKYRAADVVLVLSKSEGNPLAALEGPACGTTLVSTAVGIVPEFVSDGVDGFIVRGETDDELFDSTVATLERLAGDKELVRSAKKALSEKVRKLYSWGVMGAAWEKYICAVLDAARSSAEW